MSGQYVAYSFYRVDPAWRRLPIDERAAGKDAFAEVVEDWAGRMDALRAYSVAGVRPDCDFFLWKITERYEDLGELGAALNGTRSRPGSRRRTPIWRPRRRPSTPRPARRGRSFPRSRPTSSSTRS